MNILFVSRVCGFHGGVEQNVADTAAGLRTAGHRCVLACGEISSISPETYAGVFDSHSACRELGAADAEPFSDIVAREAPDVVYLHKVPALRPLLPSLHGRRSVMMVHDHDLCCPRRHKYYAWTGRVCHRPMGSICYWDAASVARGPSGLRWVSLRQKTEEMRAHRELDILLVGSTFMRDELVCNGFSQSQVRVLAPQVQLNAPHPTRIPERGDVLYVGQLIRGKGVDLLLEAIAGHTPEGKLRIVGTGNAEARLRAQSRKLGLQDRVQFVGWVDHVNLDTLYQSAQVVVVPSRWPEPFGMVGLEAMSHARPIVGFAVGGITDWLHDGDNGLSAPEQNTPALGRAIHRLMQDHALAVRLGEQGYRRYRDEYSFSRYVGNLEELFGLLCSSPTGGGPCKSA